jgi:hypothetical protein
MPSAFFSLVFADDGDFRACNAAEAFLAALGFSVGPCQGPAARGILFGDFLISKWRKMAKKEIAGLHGVMTGSMRNGPVKITIYNSAPSGAKNALIGRTVA